MDEELSKALYALRKIELDPFVEVIPNKPEDAFLIKKKVLINLKKCVGVTKIYETEFPNVILFYMEDGRAYFREDKKENIELLEKKWKAISLLG